jgi:hypothetical protein
LSGAYGDLLIIQEFNMIDHTRITLPNSGRHFCARMISGSGEHRH